MASMSSCGLASSLNHVDIIFPRPFDRGTARLGIGSKILLLRKMFRSGPVILENANHQKRRYGRPGYPSFSGCPFGKSISQPNTDRPPSEAERFLSVATWASNDGPVAVRSSRRA